MEFFSTTVKFSVCGDCRNINSYKLNTSNAGDSKITFSEFRSKTVKGGLKERNYAPRVVTQHSDPNNPRCVVDLFVRYLTCIPPKGPFYRRPLPPGKENAKMFSAQVVGVNTLGKYMQSMFDDAGLDKKVVNHSGRVYCCSTLYNSGFEEQEVMQRSGHRSTAVRTYKRPSEEKLKEISNALQPPLPQTQSCEKEYTCPTPVKMRATSVNQTSFASTSQGVNGSNVLKIDLPPCIDTVIISKDGNDITFSI